MKVLWINQKANFCGGAEQYIYKTAHHLKSKNIHSLFLYNPNEETSGEFLDVFDEAYPLVLVKEQILKLSPDVIYIQQLDDINILNEITSLNIPTVKFFHDHKIFCLREHKYTAIEKTTCKKKIGLNCYTCLGFLSKSKNFLGLKINTLSALKKVQNANKKIDKFVVASTYMKEHLILHDFDESKITVNPLYVDKQACLNDEKKQKKLLFVGQLITGKGIDILIEAMKDVHNSYTLDIIGSGQQEYVLKQQVKDLNLDSRINFLGKKNNEELNKFYTNAYALIIPSRAPETFNLTGIEALKCGTPVIATDVGGITQWLKDDVNGLLVNSNDANNLADKINDLILDKSLYERLSYNTYKSTIYDFTSQNHIESLEKIFEF